MWLSQSITSLTATKSVLEYLCISPFVGRSRSQFAYYFVVFFMYEIVFVTACYFTQFRSGILNMHMDSYDTFYFVQQMVRFALGPFFGIGLILSLCSRSDQLQLLKRMTALDLKLKSHLGVEPSFRRCNIEFIICCAIIAIYNYGDYFHYGNLNLDEIATFSYYFCYVHSSVYFYFYGFYIVYWTRAYIQRSEYIIDALRVMTSQKFISKSSLSIVLELIKLLFDVRESIEDAFGSMLFAIIFVLTYELSEVIFGVIHMYERESELSSVWFDYMIWGVTLLAEFTCIFVFLTRTGDVVSKNIQAIVQLTASKAVNYLILIVAKQNHEQFLLLQPYSKCKSCSRTEFVDYVFSYKNSTAYFE